MAVTALLKLAAFTNDSRYVDFAHQALRTQALLSVVRGGYWPFQVRALGMLNS